jgi:diadenosine tetraphosphatase ApaH/serine/threonine PP2A family protein phosphatase
MPSSGYFIEIDPGFESRETGTHRNYPVLIALLADIHSNRQAFTACLARARDMGAERFVLLGDYVGYGADPVWTVETIMDLVANGAVAVLGNHDSAISNPREHCNTAAQTAIEWTRGELGAAERKFLANLPLTVSDGDRLYVHADASSPAKWHYVTDTSEAVRSMSATGLRVTFCGHVHQPAIYALSATAKMTFFRPVTGAPVPLLSWRRWHVVLGSVGQPRDGISAASFAMLDTVKGEITFCRAPYDIERAAEAIRRSGLPAVFAERLFEGR